MSTMMEVDPPAPASEDCAGVGATNGPSQAGGGGEQEKTIKMHPLAIIGISDHHTRIRVGGSPLSPDSPVVGLLFGYQDGLTVSILDSEEMEYSFGGSGSNAGFGSGTEEQKAEHKASIAVKIELHQKVFPTHEVVGWYRVSDEDIEAGPNEEDLKMTHGLMKEYNESPLFVLMGAGSSGGGKEKQPAKSASAGEEAREKLERDENLPLAIYETLVTTSREGSASRQVFVNLEFDLETFEPERIAVEKVFKTQAHHVDTAAATVPSASTTGDGSGKGSAKSDKKESATPPAVVPPSELDHNLASIKSSIESMNARIEILLDFLRKTQAGTIAPNYALLRQVDCLVKQLPLVMSSGGAKLDREFTKEYDDMLLLSYLGAVAKTSRAVQCYAEKFKVYHESTYGSREMRRAY